MKKPGINSLKKNKKLDKMTNKERALMVAEKAHNNQTYDIYPYMYHIRQVVKIAEEVYSENPDEIVYREADVYDFFKKII
jgi:hypothetical protein